jgi:tRNA threonylcarbamoyladenosine biosynthesis protein TsaE
MLVRSNDPVSTRAIAAAVARLARAGDVILLSGDMGSGKTVFAQGFGRELGVDEPMTSPTFTLVNSYDCGRVSLHHADLYRLDRTGEVADLALAELADLGGILLVEWGEAAVNAVHDHLAIRIDVIDDVSDGVAGAAVDLDGPMAREIEVTASGPAWAGRWERLTAALGEWAC